MGESGSGKSVSALSLLGLVPPPGKIVEEGSVEEIYYSPKHPYTKGLLSSIPLLEKEPPFFKISETQKVKCWRYENSSN